jgi:hypothetical protein
LLRQSFCVYQYLQDRTEERATLERLCRYISGPAVSIERFERNYSFRLVVFILQHSAEHGSSDVDFFLRRFGDIPRCCPSRLGTGGLAHPVPRNVRSAAGIPEHPGRRLLADERRSRASAEDSPINGK